MKPVEISNQTARRIVLDAQLLNRPHGLKPGSDGLHEIFNRLGYIQIDTIHIIERAHHHTLWTRLPGYDATMLHSLQAVERTVFEYWAHAMSYLPMSDYRFFLYKMNHFKNPEHPWLEYLSRREKLPLEWVRNRIRDEGALTAKDFVRPEDCKRGTWWDWKPAKQALEVLFWRGELMISERRNFQKVYDLTERVLQPGIDTRLPGDREMAEYLILRALSAMGIARSTEIHDFMQPTAARDSAFRAIGWETLTRAIDELLEERKITALKIRPENGDPYFALNGTIDRLAGLPAPSRSASLLSPFDNLIIQRDRIRRIFDFDYALECYLPAKKRVHGYFLLPVLFGDKLIGRLDPQADRKTGTMVLHRISFEDDLAPSDEFIGKLSRKIAEFAKFNKCDRVRIERTQPAKWKPVLQAAVKKQMDGEHLRVRG